MEVLGAVASSFTLAALFKYSFEALDLIQLYQSQDVDFKRLQLQYELEKCRFYNWGDKMGLADDSKQNLLSEWHSKELVAETLRQVIALFSDAQVIRKKYGCDDITSSAAALLPAPDTSHGITRAFDHFRIKSPNSDESMSRLKKTKWVIRDRKKFFVLVSEVRSLIDSLEKITSDLSSTVRLEELLRIRINEITNVDTLLGIASVWKESHPRVASAASTKADTISMISGRYEFVSQWQNAVDSGASEDMLIANIEDLTITELKHSVISSNVEVETLKESLESTSQTVVALGQQLRVLTYNATSKNRVRTRLGDLVVAFMYMQTALRFSMVLSDKFSLLPGEQKYAAWTLMISAFIVTPNWLLYSQVPDEDENTESNTGQASGQSPEKKHGVRSIWSICVTFAYFTLTHYCDEVAKLDMPKDWNVQATFLTFLSAAMLHNLIESTEWHRRQEARITASI
ncbi:hypothetical protein NW768_002773 [Fusarium equiseti]|uniref:Prion-inhibition and propagation HeLo domain-containing protein n=1 Tax=Fusarium equiseti TaxID=61235 RepID=A0ABQ8RK00_FUSEQ|nr:hypothetical protein NW768_002773 [Fusarium equiseti]